MLEIHFDEYYDLLDAKRCKINLKYGPAILELDDTTIVNVVKINQKMRKSLIIYHHLKLMKKK